MRRKLLISTQAPARDGLTTRYPGRGGRPRLLRQSIAVPGALSQNGRMIQVSAQNYQRSSELLLEWDDEVFLSWHSDCSVVLTNDEASRAVTMVVNPGRRDRLWRGVVIATLPVVAVVFFIPFAIVLKISFADPLVAQPPFSDFFDWSAVPPAGCSPPSITTLFAGRQALPVSYLRRSRSR